MKECSSRDIRERHALCTQQSEFYACKTDQVEMKSEEGHLLIPDNGSDVWEIEPKHLKYGNKVASGSFGELGTYCSQDVAIKVLKVENLEASLTGKSNPNSKIKKQAKTRSTGQNQKEMKNAETQRTDSHGKGLEMGNKYLVL
ncbi:hypothetical protein K1719_012117 [Acacia pycnantha]|nr:hypothetical protein K1719_012117 [Acacia pycnantha]